MTMKTISTRLTTITAVTLLALWATSFGLSFLPLGILALPVALGIALVKATLVVLFFMELVNERFTVNITLITALTMMGLLIAIMVTDVLTRAPPPMLPPLP